MADNVDMQRLVVSLEAQFNKFAKAMDGATKVADAKATQIERRFQRANAGVSSGFDRMGRTVTAGMSGVGKSALAAQIANERLLAGMSGLSRTAGAAGKSAAALTAELKNTSSAGIGLSATLGTIGAYLGAGQIIEYANAYTRVNRALTSSKQIFGIALKSQEELTGLANEARIDVDAYANTYIRTEAAIRDYGFAAGTGATVTSTLAKALKLGSASASEQASTILQFSQALQKGKLDGDEFRTVMENAGVVQELLAERLKVSKGEILKLAADGKLGIRDLVGAMVDGGDKIDRIFKQMPTTVDEAFTVLRNNTITYVGKLNEATGATDGLVNVTAILARNIETVGDSALIVAASLLAMFTPGIIARAGTFTVAMAAAAGPIGLVVGALGGATAAMALFGNEIKVTEDKAVSLLDRLKALANHLGSTPQLSRGLAIAMRGDQKGREDLAYARATRDPNSLDPTNERDVAMARQWREGTSTEFGDGQLKKGNSANSTADANAKLTAYQRETAEVIKRTNALMAQAAMIGEATLNTEHAKTARDLLTAAEETAKRTGVAITAEQLADIDEAARKYAEVAAQVEYMNAVQSVREGTKAIQDEISLMGLYGKELETARIEQELLNAAKKAGEEITPQLMQQIRATAELRGETTFYRDAIREVQDASKEMLSSFVSDMRQGVSATEALGNALNKLADRLIDSGLDMLVNNLVGGLGASLFGGAPTTSGWGATVTKGFAGGGYTGPGGKNQPAGVVHKGEVVWSQDDIARNGGVAAVEAMRNGGGGFANGGVVGMPSMPGAPPASTINAPTTVSISLAPVFQGGGSDTAAVEKFKSEVPSLIRATMHDVFNRDPRFSRSNI